MNKKYLIYSILITGVLVAGVFAYSYEPEYGADIVYQTVNWEKPITDEGWAEDVKAESLHFKFDYQLDEMEISHSKKVPIVQEDLNRFIDCPECIKWELKQEFIQMFEDLKVALDKQLEDKTLQEWIDEEFTSQLAYYSFKVDKLNQSVERIQNEKRLRKEGFVTIIEKIPAGDERRNGIDGIDSEGSKVRSPLGTIYYIDSDCATPGDGTTATCNNDGSDSYDDLDDFNELVARTGGDKAILRRGTTATYDDGSDLLFISDGTILAPIVIEADYDDAWGDEATASETATLTFGSKTVTFAGDISGDLAAGDWIYETTEDNREFSYEVASVTGGSNEIVTLYLPYKGNISGAGKTIEIMPDAPIWNTVAGVFQWMFDADNYWKVQGIDIRGTDVNGCIELDDTFYHEFKDIIVIGDGGTDFGIKNTDDQVYLYLLKSRGEDKRVLFGGTAGTAYYSFVIIKDSYFDAKTGTVANGFFGNSTGFNIYISDSEVVGVSDIYAFAGTYPGSLVFSRNLKTNGVDSLDTLGNVLNRGNFYFEDYDNVIGDNRYSNQHSDSETRPLIKSTTTITRIGGGDTSIEVAPSTDFSTVWDWGKLLLFEYPIYADTSSKTYTVYFASDDNTDWDDDPTASELWVECEYWEHASNNFRKIKKSTGTVDFKTDTDFDQTLTVTCEPAQAGILYLRVYYAKPTEGGNTNIFYVDIAPVIS